MYFVKNDKLLLGPNVTVLFPRERIVLPENISTTCVTTDQLRLHSQLVGERLCTDTTCTGP
jgi:hypothetical protein